MNIDAQEQYIAKKSKNGPSAHFSFTTHKATVTNANTAPHHFFHSLFTPLLAKFSKNVAVFLDFSKSVASVC
jgi:hypothetical protein